MIENGIDVGDYSGVGGFLHCCDQFFFSTVFGGLAAFLIKLSEIVEIIYIVTD